MKKIFIMILSCLVLAVWPVDLKATDLSPGNNFYIYAYDANVRDFTIFFRLTKKSLDKPKNTW